MPNIHSSPGPYADRRGYCSLMDGLAINYLDSGDPYCGLVLEHLHPDRSFDADQVTREMVAIITALEGHNDSRVVLQITARPDSKHRERGTIAVHVFGATVSVDHPDVVKRLADLAEDLSDLLATPPLRWSFRPITDSEELRAAYDPFAAIHVAEIARREEPCLPVSWEGGIGYSASPIPRVPNRRLWSTWTLGPASRDLRRLAAVLMSQEAPVAVRVALAPTVLTIGERAAIEELVHDLALVAGDDSVLIASTRTIEAALFLRPLFELQCLIASPDRLSRALLSSVGYSMSEPAAHGANGPTLTGGFAILRDGADVEENDLRVQFAQLSPRHNGPTLAPPALSRLRRLVGPWEAANVFRLPVTADDTPFPGIEIHDFPDLEPPMTQLAIDGLRVGRHIGRWNQPVWIDPDERFRHLYISGQTGTGKSTLLLNLALQDIAAGAGVAVLDPHGDLVEGLLARIPEDRINDVVLVDPADPVAVVGVNLLEAESAIQRDYVVSELCAMFYALFDPQHQGIVGPMYETWLRQAALLLLAHPAQPSSMLDIPTLFTDAAVRKYLLAGVADPILTEFWKGDMEQMSPQRNGELLGWFRSKFEVFRTSSLVRNVIGQARSTISFSDVLQQQRILLVNLSKGLLGGYNSALIGHVVFSRLWAAALERASIAPGARSPFFIYIDEFQNMTTDSLPSVLSEARKFGVGLTLANQFFSQIPEMTRDAILGNVGTRVTFRVGPLDSVPFSVWLGKRVRPDDLTALPNHHAIVALSNSGVPLDPFVLRTEAPAPVESDKRAALLRGASRRNWARPVGDLDPEFFGRWAHVEGSFAEQAQRHTLAAAAVSAPSPKKAPGFLDTWLATRSDEVDTETVPADSNAPEDHKKGDDDDGE